MGRALVAVLGCTRHRHGAPGGRTGEGGHARRVGARALARRSSHFPCAEALPAILTAAEECAERLCW
eukprot:10526483-Lingulodinium_polyedra.AAC.1